MTPGYKTTEFWLSLSHQLLTVALAAGLITQAGALQWEGAVAGVVGIVFTALSGWGVVTTYTAGRNDLKQQTIIPATKIDPRGIL